MKKKYLRALAKAAAVRAIKTVAQTAIATIGSAAVLGAVELAYRCQCIRPCWPAVSADKHCGIARSARQ